MKNLKETRQHDCSGCEFTLRILGEENKRGGEEINTITWSGSGKIFNFVIHDLRVADNCVILFLRTLL